MIAPQPTRRPFPCLLASLAFASSWLGCGGVSGGDGDGDGDGDAGSSGGFALTLSLEDAELRDGEELAIIVGVGRDEGFTGAVEITATDLPDGVTAPPVTADAAAASVTITLSAAMPRHGQGSITIRGVSGATERSADLSLLVRGQPGTLDNSFASEGLFRLDVGGRGSVGRSLVLDGEGRILVAGSSDVVVVEDAMVLRLDADGGLDESFGTGGFAASTELKKTTATSLVVLPDGRIIAAGSIGDCTVSGSNCDYAFFGFGPDGAIDSTFGLGGITVADAVLDRHQIKQLALSPNGDIYAVGDASSNTNLEAHVLRMSAGGGPPTVISTASLSRISDLLIEPNASVLAVGVIRGDFLLARYLSDGTADPSFDGDGGLVIGFEESARVLGVLDDGTNYIVAGVAGGNFESFNDGQIAVATVARDGTVLASQATTIDLKSFRGGPFFTLDDAGRLLVVGTNKTGQPLLVALDASGALDGSLGAKTIDTGLAADPNASLFGVALDAAGRIIVAGSASENVFVARLWP